MKLTIERATLLSSLAHVQSVVERRATIPILVNVRIDALEGDRLRLTATDMDLAVVDEAEATVEQEGAVTTAALTLYDIVRKLPDGAQVAMRLDGDDNSQLGLISGRSRFRLLCLPIADYPALADGELSHSFELPREHLRRLIDKTRFAISTEETRYYLNGIYLHQATGEDGAARLRAVATDGHRLSCADVALPEGVQEMPGVIVPRKAVTEVRKLIDDGEEPVSVALSETRIRFEVGAAVLTSKLIDGSFPDYERVIPRDNKNILTLASGGFAEAVDRVSSVCSDRSSAIKLSISPGQVTLTAGSPETGTATEELDADYDAAPLDIGLNARYVLDVAGQVEGESIRFSFADAGSPSLVRDTGDSGALHVIMPLRV